MTGPQARRTTRTLWLLTLSTTRRLLREGMVLRSLVWPGLVVIGTLTATIAVMATVSPTRTVGVTASAPAPVLEALRAGAFTVREVSDPGVAVREGVVPIATDGRRLWVRASSSSSLEAEAILRAHHGAPWRPDPRIEKPSVEHTGPLGRAICRLLAVLFVVYAAVFGLGSVARDRDDGTLESELTLPVPRWVGGLARWIAATLVLSTSYALTVLTLNAVIGLDDPGATIRHGAAACAAGVALGVMVVGTAGIKQGFSGPFAVALSAVTGLAGLGGATGIGWLPIASLFGGGAGWTALATALGSGLLAAAVYGYRTGRA